jgi:hypothetical protein
MKVYKINHIKALICFGYLFMFVSCNRKIDHPEITNPDFETKSADFDKTNIKKTVVYSSEENDLALIQLKLIPDGTFEFLMNIFPEPIQNTENEIISTDGFWSKKDKIVTLNFASIEKDSLRLDALFDSNYKVGNEFKVIDAHQVEIDFSLNHLHIWGVRCFKTE